MPKSVQYSVATYSDASEQERALAGWEQLYRQVGAGRFEGSTTTLDLGAISIAEERLNVELAQQSCPPKGKIVLIVHQDVISGRLNGQAQSAQLFFHRGGYEVDIAMSPPDSRGCYIMLDEKLLPDLDFRHAEPIAPIHHPDAAALARWTLSILASAPQSLREAPQAMASVVPGMIADRAWEVCNHMLAGTVEKRPRETYAYSLFRRARARVMDDPGQMLGVSDLATYLNVPEHVMRQAFLDAAGVTPREWLRLYRLDRARRAMLQPGKAPKTVAQVAMEAGFFHFGRFAAYYAQLFHETPMETLRSLIN